MTLTMKQQLVGVGLALLRQKKVNQDIVAMIEINQPMRKRIVKFLSFILIVQIGVSVTQNVGIRTKMRVCYK